MITAARARLVALALLAPLALSCGSPVVGADCAPGASQCGDRCFDLQNDPDHCGACDHSCGAFECRDAQCGPGLRDDRDAGSGDGGAVVIDGPPFLPDGGFEFPDLAVGRGCSLGETGCGNTCTNLSYDSANCRECGRVCPADTFCFQGDCTACTDPLRRCVGSCVDVATNINHCGRCRNPCRSGICEDGVCADLLTGHLVVIGHDYSAGASSTARRLVGNALFLAQGFPVRTVVYEGSSATASVDGVTSAIDFVVDTDGRDWAPRSVAARDLGAELREADALIVHAQGGSRDAELEQLGQRVGLALSQFLLRGGVIVVLETASPTNAGTFRLLEPAGLFAAGSREALVAQSLEVTTPGVGVAARTTRTYGSPASSVRFLTITTPGTQIVRDRDGETVVFHRVVTP